MIKLIVLNSDGSALVRLRDVRLSFPSLFKPTAFGGGEGDKKYQATFLMERDSENHKNMEKAIKHVLKEGHKGKTVPKDKLCLKDCAEREYDGYEEGYLFVPSSAPSSSRLTVVDRNSAPLIEEDGKPYAGCYVNASVRIWPQNNEYGKRVNAQLKAVQFFRDGEPFGDSPADADEEFEKYEDDAGDPDDPLI